MAGAVRVLLGGALDVGAGAASAVAPTLAAANPADYFSDMLLRSDQTVPDANSGATRSEVTRIFVTDMHAGKLATDDRNYLARMVARRTGMSQADAERRVDDIYDRLSKTSADAQAAAKEAADKARKAAAYSALWMFVALLLGAFVASLAATFGGRQRDSAHVYLRS